MTSSAEEHTPWVAGVFDRAAATYDRIGDPYHQILGRRLLEVTAPDEGYALLDVACGRGAVLAAAAGRAGRRVGVDVSAEMISQASADLDGAELAVMDAERLDLPDAAFDVVTCAFAVFFLPHPERAAAEFHRVLRPGGRVAVSVWGDEDPRWAWEDDLFAGRGVARRPVRRPFDRPGELVELLADTGFGDLRTYREELEISFADPEQWWEWNWSFSRRGTLEQLGDEALAEVRAGAREHLATMVTPAGIPMRLTAWFAIGSR